MQKNTVIAFVVAGLLVAIGAIYLISAYEEPIEAAEESAAAEGGVGSGSGSADTGMDMSTLVQTTFFAIAGLANLGVASWMIIIVISKRKMTRMPYTLVVAGSAFLIVLYVASRTVNLPIVGLQEDIGTIDIISKVLQGIVVGLSVYAVSISQRLNEQIKNRLR